MQKEMVAVKRKCHLGEAGRDDGERVHPETAEHDEKVENGERLEKPVEDGAVTSEAGKGRRVPIPRHVAQNRET